MERIAKKMLKSGDVKTAFDLEERLRKSFEKIIKSMLEAEMDKHLENEKYKHKEDNNKIVANMVQRLKCAKQKRF